ncbi:MAG: RluA family pseudouridine synthase [Patescibacteria group bacterium]
MQWRFKSSRAHMEILYEDDDVVVVNKPAGLVVHSDGRTIEPSVSEWFVLKYPESRDVGEKLGGIERPGIVHRIDRETSGALLLAKTERGHATLKKQFQNREIEKTYHLFSYGNIKDDFGTINLPIGRSKKDFRKRVASKSGVREAVTYFKVLKRPPAGGPEVTFVEAKPKTGRTHQIRVHFQALHHPILGDKLYGPKIAPRSLGEAGPIFKRLALHARQIKFKNTQGEVVTIKAPYPADFQQAVDMLG